MKGLESTGNSSSWNWSLCIRLWLRQNDFKNNTQHDSTTTSTSTSTTTTTTTLQISLVSSLCNDATNNQEKLTIPSHDLGTGLYIGLYHLFWRRLGISSVRKIHRDQPVVIITSLKQNLVWRYLVFFAPNVRSVIEQMRRGSKP